MISFLVRPVSARSGRKESSLFENRVIEHSQEDAVLSADTEAS